MLTSEYTRARLVAGMFQPAATSATRQQLSTMRHKMSMSIINLYSAEKQTLATCLSKERSDEIVTPRTWTWSLAEIDSMPNSVLTTVLTDHCSRSQLQSYIANSDVQKLCVAWRQALRRIWKLPYNCHTAILERLSGTFSLFDSLCNK